MKHIIIILLAVVLFAGCASTFKNAVQTAKDGAELWWNDDGKEQVVALATKSGKQAAVALAAKTEEKLTAVLLEKTGKPPAAFEKPDGSIDWWALSQAGMAGAAAYLGIRTARRTKEKWGGLPFTPKAPPEPPSPTP